MSVSSAPPEGNPLKSFSFGSVDYVVFIIMLIISTSVGVYFGFFAKAKKTTDEYLMGGKRMKTIPIAISLVASQLSGIAIMSLPGEMYAFGANWFFNVIPMIVIVPILNWIVVPVFYKNDIYNCYEYLRLRFNVATQNLLSTAFITTMFFMLPVFLFLPALAFSQVTGMNIHLINAIVCSICVFYTMFGGIKAVVWTDVIQGSIMLFAMAFICLIGVSKVGGFGEVLSIASEGKRLDIDFTLDATTRSTMWNCSMNAIILWIAYLGLNQSCVQRIVSLPSLGHAQRSLTLFGFGFFIIQTFNCFTGVVMFAYYYGCDPLTAGYVEKSDKMMPYFVQDIVGQWQGMPGLFISCVFSAALSTMSAIMNSLSGVIYMDYIKPRITHTESRANLILKLLVLALGVYCIMAGFIVEKFSSILQIIYSIGGVTFGAVFGVFLMGMLVPRAHGKAAFWSVIISMAVMFVIVVGAQGRVHYSTLDASIDKCVDLNVTSISPKTLPQETVSKDFNIFEVSFNWYNSIGGIIVFVVGIGLSYVLPSDKEDEVDPNLLAPFVQRYLKYKAAPTEEIPEDSLENIELEK